MDTWQAPFLGLRELPHELSQFELQCFFTYTPSERTLIDERRQPILRLGLALQIGYLRMTGHTLDGLRIIPITLWQHLGRQLDVQAPDLASLRALYRRGQTLFDHQQLACRALGFAWMSEHQRRYLVTMLRDELAHSADRDRLLGFARRWLYEHRLLIAHDRALRKMIAAAIAQFEVELNDQIRGNVTEVLLTRWREQITSAHRSGVTMQSWLWAAPAKQSARQIEEMLERIEFLRTLEVHQHLADVPHALLRRYARRLTARKPSLGARIKEPARSIEVACFLRYCLLSATDQLILMVRRRIAELWRKAAEAIPEAVDWKARYGELVGEIEQLTQTEQVLPTQLLDQLKTLLDKHAKHKAPTHAHRVREQLIEAVRPIRALLASLVNLPWQAASEHPVIQAVTRLQDFYRRKVRLLPDKIDIALGGVWRDAINGYDRERALRAFEVATLSALRRAVRNGSVWITHSAAFGNRDQLFIPAARWKTESRRHYARLGLPAKAAEFLEPLLNRIRSGLEAVAGAARAGTLHIDDELHLNALAAEEEDPQVSDLRTALERRIGEAQLPELILDVDARVRFSWIMLGREPRSSEELLMVYAGILAHGTALSAAETARMIPQLSANAVRQAMRWAGDERRLSEACAAVLEFMHQHPIAAHWGRSDLASSDMMSLETSRRVWQARIDPRRQTPSLGIYTHVRQRWGIFYAQPIVLNERQAGAAIEGVVRQERVETTQLAVDTHGYTDFAMALARLLGFDLCPRLKELKQRRFYVPSDFIILEELRAVTLANVNLEAIIAHWDALVHASASVHSGHGSAVHMLAHFSSAARGDPVYEAGVQLGRLLRTLFLTDYFVKPEFRREILRVLNRGETVNSLKRAIYTGRVAGHQAKREDEMQAVSDALSLLANIVMAWNTAKMQGAFDHWNGRREKIAPALISKIAPTRLEGKATTPPPTTRVSYRELLH